MKIDKVEKQVNAINSSKKIGHYRVFRMSATDFYVKDTRPCKGKDEFVLRSASALEVAEFMDMDN